MEYLHTMIRVTDLKATIAFFELMGFAETRRIDNEKARYTLVFLAAPDDVESAKASRKPTVELTYNWDPEDYKGGRNLNRAHPEGRAEGPGGAVGVCGEHWRVVRPRFRPEP